MTRKLSLFIDSKHSLEVEQILLASKISNILLEITTESQEYNSYPKPLLIIDRGIVLFPLQAIKFLVQDSSASSPSILQNNSNLNEKNSNQTDNENCNNNDYSIPFNLSIDSNVNLESLISKFKELPIFMQIIVFTNACLFNLHLDSNLSDYFNKYGKINIEKVSPLSSIKTCSTLIPPIFNSNFNSTYPDQSHYSSSLISDLQRLNMQNQIENNKNNKKRPIKGNRNILITAALPYVNNAPHLGNIVGAVLSADVYARYCRGRNWNTLFICGTDEFGTATETKALEEGISCNDLCDKYHLLHSSIYSWFQCSFDHFGRTVNPHQTSIVHEIFWELWNNGYFIENEVEQTFCVKCNRFLADRYIEGTCPKCSFIDARGDQCDKCGHLIDPIELVDPKCKMCRSKPIIKSSKHLFLDLTKLQSQVEEFIDAKSKKGEWSHNSISIARAWLIEGLKPRCMTRDLKWGTSIPLPEYKDKVFYVWFDAPIGYISICADYDPEGWREWWLRSTSSLSQSNENSNDTKNEIQNNQNNNENKEIQNNNENGNATGGNVTGDDLNVELYQFMGKDNVPFHTVIFPATLLGTKKPFTLLHHINTTEYLNYESGKFSKSRGIGVFGDGARDSGIGVSIWRYYLLAIRPEHNDTTFSWDDFQAKINGELASNLGNFINRTTKFIYSKLNGIVPGISTSSSTLPSSSSFCLDSFNPLFGTSENNFISNVNEELKNYHNFMNTRANLRSALKSVMTISSFGNQYLSETHLDMKLLEGNPEYCGIVLTLSINLLYLLASIMEPFIPKSSEDLCAILNIPSIPLIPFEFNWNFIKGGHCIKEPFILFKRIEDAQVAELKIKFSGVQK